MGVSSKKIKTLRVIPISLKVTVVFSLFLLATNFFSNYMNFLVTSRELLHHQYQLMARDLEQIMDFSILQFEREIGLENQSRADSIKYITDSASLYLKDPHSLFLSIDTDGKVIIQVSKNTEKISTFTDTVALEKIRNNWASGAGTFFLNEKKYYSVYKYSPSWNSYFIRAEEDNEFLRDSSTRFINMLLFLAIPTLLCVITGAYVIHYQFRYIRILTKSIQTMIVNKYPQTVDVSKAANDDITYLNIIFNHLSVTLQRLLNTMKCFVARDIATRAYDGIIPLGGTQKELAVLFTDISQFSRITEMLGVEVITLLNAHYKEVIEIIHLWNGDVNSIIGDALLAVFGVIDDKKSSTTPTKIEQYYNSLKAALEIQKHISPSMKELTFVGIGIDAGEVFYGTIGTQDRMVNTVIGDQVNSASRLEGLTRRYNVPLICSDRVRKTVENTYEDFTFLELDTVIVSGKTIAQKVYWVLETQTVDPVASKQLQIYTSGLQHYYKGEWGEALAMLNNCELPPAQLLIQRMNNIKTPPTNWTGTWQMKAK